MSNVYRRLMDLLPSEPIQAGEVVGIAQDGVIVELPTGVKVRARGEAEVGDHVYIRGGAVEGPAPALTGTDIEV